MWDVDEDIDGGAATDTHKDDSQDPRPDLRGGKGEGHSCFLDTFADDINKDDDIEEDDNKFMSGGNSRGRSIPGFLISWE